MIELIIRWLSLLVLVVCIEACSSGNTSSGVSSLNGTNASPEHYDYLYKHNATMLAGRTVRWPSKHITVSGANSGVWRRAIRRWSEVEFVFVDTGGAIQIGYGASDDWCGRADRRFQPSGALLSCTIRISSSHQSNACGSESDTVTHEVGHCLGYYGESFDGGIMDLTAAGSSEITEPVRNMMSLLYSLPPGYDITSRLSN